MTSNNPRVRIGFILLLLLLAFLHAAGFRSVDLVVLVYIGVGILIVFIDEFQEFTLGKDGFSFKRRADQALENYGVGGKPMNATIASSAPDSVRELVHQLDDPNKNRFGERSVANGKSISATVRPYPGNQEWYFIRIVVGSVNLQDPLVGQVTIYLHPTFKKSIIDQLAVDGKAIFETVAWGAFTVGAICDNGHTKLELDLSELPDAPALFRKR